MQMGPGVSQAGPDLDLTCTGMWITIAIIIHAERCFMRTIQMTLDEDLVQAVDRVSKQLCTTRSAFTRKALREALACFHAEQLEQKHRKGYERHPVSEEEFFVWESEQAWGQE